MRVVVLGLGYVGTTLMVGVEKIKRGELDYCGIPLGNNLKYKVEDIEFVSAYDVDLRKVGKSVYEVSLMYHNSVPDSLKEIVVHEGVHLNSLKGLPLRVRGLDYRMSLRECVERLIEEWSENSPEVFINLCTTEKAEPFNNIEKLREAIDNDEKERVTATQLYAYAAIEYAKYNNPVVFINGIPTPIANDLAFVKLGKEVGVTFFGDDGATGATPLITDLLEHLVERRREVLSIAQFNIGGNMDFLSLTLKERNKAKERTKSKVVKDVLGYNAPHFIKPTGYLEPLGDKKFVAMHIMYKSFNNAIDEVIINMRVNDSPAFAGLLVDLIRLGRIALDRRYFGTIYEVNAFYMKSPGPPGSKVISKVLAFYLLLNWLGDSLHVSESISPAFSNLTLISNIYDSRRESL